MTLPLAAPALPLHTAGPYVAAAYIVFVVLVIAYIAIIALRTGRTERALEELRRDALARRQEDDATSPGAHEPGVHEPDAEKEPVASGRLMQAPAVASQEGERGQA